ncbi:hypothetical protein CXG81DRAFT_29955 [Caulochytrium protostelioides]|uniref:Mitochondrial carrier n=1 Tax=Caulochytrium protostelioides TaxID=1555241 RepID=A0A4P9X5W0_9FUNG|nr:hypothetical protein CXG81DRAFT_29955 [Caulochytrium protostelioides]|eukprot:RKP00535.1 hypothetical protein CXG81DRAFT_29955 [Caulochytrium protostelioides]
MPPSPSPPALSASPAPAPAPAPVKTPAKPPAPVTQWWFGGAASCAAAACTHPLDTLKMLVTEGVLSFYSGLSASLLRQITYSTTRFGVYEQLKTLAVAQQREACRGTTGAAAAAAGQLPFTTQVAAATLAGIAGGLVGTPADLTNVRMQNDGKLPPAERRNYRNAFHGLVVIARTEGPRALFSGLGPNVTRGALMTASQIATYDSIKQRLVTTFAMGDTIATHFSASLIAGLIATLVCSPFDVLKTRMMSSHRGGGGGGQMGVVATATQLLRHEGVRALFHGFGPAFVRLGPHTILTFLAFEKIKEIYNMPR